MPLKKGSGKEKMKLIKFSDIKNDLLLALKEKLEENPIPNDNGFSLIEGFIRLPIYTEISSDVFTGGQNLPAVAIIGKTSGRIYTFALKAILPDLEF